MSPRCEACTDTLAPGNLLTPLATVSTGKESRCLSPLQERRLGHHRLNIRTATHTGPISTQRTLAFFHGRLWLTCDRFCVDPTGEDVLVLAEGDVSSSEDSDHDHAAGSGQEIDCHFHAGVE